MAAANASVGTVSGTTSSISQAGVLNQARILVVEDMPSLRAMVAETMGEVGAEPLVHTAGDGREALARIDAAAAPYHLIVSDIMMPHLDGEGLLRELRQRQYPAAVVMLTALGQDDMVVRCLRLGACDYLVKPDGAGPDVLRLAAANALAHPPAAAQDLAIEYDSHGWFEITGRSDASVLYTYRRFLGLLQRFALPEPAASEVRLALEELGRNAIEWGNAGDRGKKVTFGARILPGKIIVYIEDEGPGFNPDRVPDPSIDPLRHIESRKEAKKRIGGYGIHLIKHLMDKLVYNAKGNRVVAIKYFPVK